MMIVMIALALILLPVAVLLAVAAVAGSDPVSVEVFMLDVETTTLGVFLAGLGTGVITLIGVAALTVGLRQVAAYRKEINYLRQKVAEQTAGPTKSSSDDAAGGKRIREKADLTRQSGGRSATAAS